jgi:hypothetical protein
MSVLAHAHFIQFISPATYTLLDLVGRTCEHHRYFHYLNEPVCKDRVLFGYAVTGMRKIGCPLLTTFVIV